MTSTNPLLALGPASQGALPRVSLSQGTTLMAALPINAVKSGQTSIPSSALPASLFYHIQPGK